MSVKETGQRVLKARPSLFVQAGPVTKGYLVKPAFQEKKGKTVKKSLKEHSEGGLKGGNHCGEVKLTILTRRKIIILSLVASRLNTCLEAAPFVAKVTTTILPTDEAHLVCASSALLGERQLPRALSFSPGTSLPFNAFHFQNLF